MEQAFPPKAKTLPEAEKSPQKPLRDGPQGLVSALQEGEEEGEEDWSDIDNDEYGKELDVSLNSLLF